MGWDGHTLTIGISVNSSGGERDERGHQLYKEFSDRLTALCEEYNQPDNGLLVAF